MAEWSAPEWSASVVRWQLWSDDDEEWLESLRTRYEVWRMEEKASSDEVLIPRVLHQIWLGPAILPFEAFRLKWQRLHPLWEMRLWRDAEVEDLMKSSVCGEAYARASNYGEKSDIARYEILRKFGGVYVDCDFEPLKPLDALLGVGLFAGFSNVGAVELNNGILGARRGHPLMAACVQRIKTPKKQDLAALVLGSGFLGASSALAETLAERDAATTIESTGPGYFTRIFCTHPTADALCLPPEVFYAAPNTSSADKMSFTTEASLALHHWAKSWITTTKHNNGD